ncbi:OmpA family protein [Shimia aestuarii]|uniref:OmpA-OmpF porin, OOP family n=1 Tax=Shimia aestuarii TaxID=254406 RepID=A0A1I4JCJ1_9RHOB|nr:OmpA family protein [Shimia aestuarii]SFL64265.1 OmpA-OmpF porin, OOP family [Shimia aestuarii]
MKRGLAISLAVWPGLAAGFEPVLPEGAQLLGDVRSAQGFYAVPTGPFTNDEVPSDRLPGAVMRRSWRIPSGFAGTGAMAADLTAQLLSAGYDIVFSCDAELCGGFDFRFNTEVLPPPEMFVDLSDYQFTSGFRDGDSGPEGVGVLVSRTAQAGMVQVIEVSPAPFETQEARVGDEPSTPRIGTTGPARQDTTLRPDVVDADSIPLWLERTGHIVLSDLEFETGSSRLGAGPFRSLDSLAAYLNADTTRRVALVGHTDSEGSLAQNSELSRKRAVAVQARLVEAYGVGAGQLEAQGVGFLSPIASNLTEEGRNANRRVEAVLLNTE